MKGKHLIRAEIRRVFCSRMTWAAMALTVLAPLVGVFGWYNITRGNTMASIHLANPISIGTLAGTLLFAALTLCELGRVRCAAIAPLVDSIAPVLVLQAMRLLAVLAAAFATVLLSMLLYLPYTLARLGIVFSWADYFGCFLLLQLPGILFGCMAAALCDQIFYRADVGFVAVLTLLLVSRGSMLRDFFLTQWSLPLLPALSDDFSNAPVFRLASYNRAVWLCLFGGGWLLSLLCIRRYGKGLFGSVRKNLGRGLLPLLGCLLLAGGAALWYWQPMIDHSPVDWMVNRPERHPSTELKIAGTELEVGLNTSLFGAIAGVARYQLQNPSATQQPLFLDLNPGYKVKRMTANGAPISWEDHNNDYIAKREISCLLPADSEIELCIEYGGMPKIWNAMEELCSGALISRRYVDLKGAHLAPVPQAEVESEETPLALHCRMERGLTPVTSGFTASLESENSDGTCTWLAKDVGESTMQLFAGDYVRVDLHGGNMPIEFYYSRKHQQQLEQIDAISMMEAAIEYCTRHYGPRAFTEEKPFKIIQQTEFAFGGFAAYNISAIGEYSFAAANLEDPEKGAGGAEVLAHEIIHQWWGLGSQLDDPQDIFWTDEGITTYTTYRLMKELKGEAYADQWYLNVWEADVESQKRNFYLRHPEYLSVLPRRYSAMLESGIQGVNLYSGTALMIHRAAEQVGGEQALDQILSRLYREGGSEMPPSITLNDFLDACGLRKEDVGRE